MPKELPKSREKQLYDNLNSLLKYNMDAKYYMGSGCLDTFIRHRARQEGKGYGFRYRIVNEPNVEKIIVNTLSMTDGSRRERNLIFDLQEGDDCFSFLEDILDLQKYKQLDNSVTISVIEGMALFFLECIDVLMKND